MGQGVREGGVGGGEGEVLEGELIQPSTQRLKTSGESEEKAVEGTVSK